MIDIYEIYVFMVVNRKLSWELFLINGSLVFYVFLYKYGDNYLEVEIKKLIGMVQFIQYGYRENVEVMFCMLNWKKI